jgi:hypothetical protein
MLLAGAVRDTLDVLEFDENRAAKRSTPLGDRSTTPGTPHGRRPGEHIHHPHITGAPSRTLGRSRTFFAPLRLRCPAGSVRQWLPEPGTGGGLPALVGSGRRAP